MASSLKASQRQLGDTRETLTYLPRLPPSDVRSLIEGTGHCVAPNQRAEPHPLPQRDQVSNPHISR